MVREELEALDRRDPLRGFRDRFLLPAGVYLDGNSLGPVPRTLPGRIEEFLSREWGTDLIASWNRHDWIGLPERLGTRIAPLLGAAPDEVVAADSVSVNLFKLLGALLRRSPGRSVVLGDLSNFPTDLYVAEGVVRLAGDASLRLVAADDFEAALAAPDVAVATLGHVDFRTGRMRDLARVTEAGRARGVPVVWDLSHSAGAMALDLPGDGAEYAVGCGYKYLNGGPGAPAFLYVAKGRQDGLLSPLSGWMGHRRPFAFPTGYEPAPGMRRFLAGTPAVLAGIALEEGLQTFEGVDLGAVRHKGEALGEAFRTLAIERLGRYGAAPAGPERAEERGSQLSLRCPEAFAVMRALIERGVTGDFREPDLLRFGFAPLYVRYVDAWDAVEALRSVLDSGAFREPRFHERGRVT